MANHFRLTIWKPNAQRDFERVPIEGCASLDEDAKIAAVATPSANNTTVIVQPIRSANGAIGVAIVPDWHGRPVVLNGNPLRAGMHLLHESDCLEVGATRYWVSAENTAEETAYDPAIHGDDSYCALTKARLVAGQPITICPGTHSARCGALLQGGRLAPGDAPIQTANAV